MKEGKKKILKECNMSLKKSYATEWRVFQSEIHFQEKEKK